MRAQQVGKSAVSGVLPTGNANDHRRTVRQQPLMRSILTDRFDEIDLLQVMITRHDGSQTVRYAHSYAGFGLTPVVARELNRHTLNPLRESWIVLKTFYKYRAFTAEVDGRKLKYDSIICTNIHRMAKLLRVAKDASPRDGRFEVVLFPARTKPRLLLTLLKAATVGLKTDRLTAEFELRLLQSMPMQLDGEVYSLDRGDKVEITAAPSILKTVL
jgi:diacylglycerol kinase family enzyme